jgi:hypothetical protein
MEQPIRTAILKPFGIPTKEGSHTIKQLLEMIITKYAAVVCGPSSVDLPSKAATITFFRKAELTYCLNSLPETELIYELPLPDQKL